MRRRKPGCWLSSSRCSISISSRGKILCIVKCPKLIWFVNSLRYSKLRFKIVASHFSLSLICTANNSCCIRSCSKLLFIADFFRITVSSNTFAFEWMRNIYWILHLPCYRTHSISQSRHRNTTIEKLKFLIKVSNLIYPASFVTNQVSFATFVRTFNSSDFLGTNRQYKPNSTNIVQNHKTISELFLS